MAPTRPAETWNAISRGPEQTQRLGQRLGNLLQPGDIICLEGALGAGKTCLAQGIGRGMGVALPITSPTFIIVNEYPIPHKGLKLYHIDLYRVESTDEACATGLEDYFYGDGVCVVEWAERVVDILPEDRLWVTLRYVDDTTRQVLISATGARYEELLRLLQP